MKKQTLLALFLVLALAQATCAREAKRARTTLHPDGTSTRSTYDFEKHTIENEHLNAEDKVQLRSFYQTNPQGHLLYCKIFSPEGRLLLVKTYENNSQGKILRENVYTPEKQLLREVHWSYDSQGNAMEPRIVEHGSHPLLDAETARQATPPTTTAPPEAQTSAPPREPLRLEGTSKATEEAPDDQKKKKKKKRWFRRKKSKD